ncbi:MAG: hypothetical protein KDJ98_20770 [Rhodobacteraceae bacterium]|nr:hypothetical protein [Paracoccaceae bacterium]
MTHFIGLSRLALNPLRRFKRDTRGTISVELVIVMPLLLWALAATVVFYDGFRNRYHAQMAAQTVADIMSRETDMFTADYVEGLNDVFDFLADSRYPTRIRVSSVIWDSEHERNRLQWSYGTRGLSGLPEDTFELMQAGDYETLRAEFGDDDSFSFAGGDAQMPITDLPNRIPPVLPGEALLLVETFALWTPFTNVGVGQLRFTPVVVVRPRFAPWINFDGVEPIYPEDNYEITWTGGGGNDTLPDPNDPDPDPTPTDTTVAFTFDNAVTTGWSASTITSGGPSGGFLGPFGGETYARPVTLDVAFTAAPETATIEFDLLILDTWDGYSTQHASELGDTLELMIDGTPITLDAFYGGAPGMYGQARSAAVYRGGALYEVTMTPTRTGSNFAGSAGSDQIWHVAMRISRPLQRFQLGFSASTNSAISDESFGIDNVRIASSGTGRATPYFTPQSSAFTQNDRYTRFPQYRGDPEFQIAAPWISMTNAQLTSSITIERLAGGPTNLNGVRSLPGWGYLNASPSLVFNYDNLGRAGTGARLRMMMDDGNSGYTCDTTLLVRDPNGQWWFNDDIQGWNAGLQMGNAVSGQYVVWIGTYDRAQCASRIRFEAY